MTDEVIFETDRIYFVKLNEKYINDYLDTVNDLEVQKFITHKLRHYTREQELEWIKTNLEKNALMFTMIAKDTNKFIGNIEFEIMNENTAELGICINAKQQNNHYGQEAINGLLDYAFEKYGITVMVLNVFNFNLRARACYKKVGFIEDGPGKEEDDIHMTYVRK